MTTYICKCGRRVKKSTDASTTGNRLSGYAPGHECWGCPYAMPYGNYQWDESARTVSRETQGYECRMSKTLTYASEFAGSIAALNSKISDAAQSDFENANNIAFFCRRAWDTGKGSYSRLVGEDLETTFASLCETLNSIREEAARLCRQPPEYDGGEEDE